MVTVSMHLTDFEKLKKDHHDTIFELNTKITELENKISGVDCFAASGDTNAADRKLGLLGKISKLQNELNEVNRNYKLAYELAQKGNEWERIAADWKNQCKVEVEAAKKAVAEIVELKQQAFDKQTKIMDLTTRCQQLGGNIKELETQCSDLRSKAIYASNAPLMHLGKTYKVQWEILHIGEMRKHSSLHREAMRLSLGNHGLMTPLIIDPTGLILDGQLRYKLLKDLSEHDVLVQLHIGKYVHHKNYKKLSCEDWYKQMISLENSKRKE